MVTYQASTSKSAMASIFAKRNQTIPAPTYDEFIRYQNENVLPALEEHDPFKWWQINKIHYPKLSQLAMKYLSIPATSVPSERLFSDTGKLITSERTLLNPNLVEKLMFLKRNKNYINIQYKTNWYN